MEASIGFENKANEEVILSAAVLDRPPTGLNGLKKTRRRLRKRASFFSALDAAPVFWLSECLRSNR